MSVYIVSHDGDNCKVMTVKRRDVSEKQISYSVSDGNKKYNGNDETGFIIWSIMQGITCPFATKLCMAGCYARKAWNAYPTVRVSRKENMRAVYGEHFVQDMAAIILKKASTGKNKNRKRIIVRIHESGDYFSDWYVNAWLQIAKICEQDARIEFWSYTKSFVWFDGIDFSKHPNFKLRASVWADTASEQIAIIERNNWPIYTAVDKFSDHDDFTHCRCDDCATCENPCGNMSILKIACEIH